MPPGEENVNISDSYSTTLVILNDIEALIAQQQPSDFLRLF